MSRVLAISAIISAKVLPNTIFLERYRKFRATYRNTFDGSELPVSKRVIQRFHDVLDDLKVPQETRNKIKIFTVHDIHMFHAGSVSSSYGAIIGIPPSYEYESAQHLTTDQIDIENKTTSWTEETSQKFLESLVLSENAQKFAIAREVLRAQSLEFLIKTVNLFLDCVMTLITYDLIYKFNKYAKTKRLYRYTLKTICVMGAVILWKLTEEIMDSYTDRNIAEKLVKLGPKYVEGGKEFYEKLYEVNNVKYQLMNTDKSFYILQLWMKRTDLSTAEQKEFFTLKLQELESNIM